ncbi:MAG: leucine-rich repeat protein [Clostridia bacterium]|nr:leucine-rich repeat protein [Clostridia bacterium]
MQHRLFLRKLLPNVLTVAFMAVFVINYFNPVKVLAGESLEDPATGYSWTVSHQEGGLYVYDVDTHGAKVTNLVIPQAFGEENVLRIGSACFKGNTDLVSVYIPDTVYKIEESAFEGCTNLVDVRLPDSLLYIDDNAFMDCVSLGDIYIPKNADVAIDAIGLYHNGAGLRNDPYFVAHVDVDAVTANDWDPWGLPMAYVIGDYSYMPNNVMEPTEVVLKKYDIKHTATATSIEIPGEIMIPNASSAISIETVAADFCKGNELLHSVVFADNIKYIGANAFDGCTDLMNLHLPENLQSVGSEAFMDCGLLGDTYIPRWAEFASDSIGLVRSGACLMNAPYFVAHVDYLAPSADDWGPWGTPYVYVVDDFSYIPVGYPNITELVLYKYNIKGTATDADITIPGEVTLNPSDYEINQVTAPVTEICDNAFVGNNLIKSVTIGEGITIINDYAFAECENLSSVTFPDTLETIYEGAFYGCKKITDVTFPKSVEDIGDYSFTGTALTRAVIPNVDTNVGWKALGFDMSYNPVEGFEIICPYGTNSQGYNYANYWGLDYHYYVGNLVFDIVNNEITMVDVLDQPKSILLNDNLHYNSENPSDYAPITTIGPNFAENDTNLKTIFLGSEIATIDAQAFTGCTNIESVCCTKDIFGLYDWDDSVTRHACGADGVCEKCHYAVNVDVTIDKPVADKALDTDVDYSLPDSATITDSVSWSPAASKADYSTSYTVSILTTIQNVDLVADIEFTVNGNECTYSKISDGVFQLSYTFDKTSDKPEPTPDPTPEPTPDPTPTNKPTPTSEPTPTASPKPSVEPTPTAVPELNVGDFINRCYEVALGREADEAGLNYWVDGLNNGELCGAQVGFGFIFSEEYINKNRTNEEFVNDMYAMYFGREADEAGFNYWVEQLNNEIATREDIMAGFANSEEFFNLCGKYGVVCGTYLVGVPNDMQGGVNSFVARLYKVCLNRLPDQLGQTGWVMKLQSGEVTGSTCAHGFVFSTEFIELNLDNTDFVKYMYRAFFGREADEVGLSYWVDMLNGETATREDVFNGFTGSPEFANLCASYGINV